MKNVKLKKNLKNMSFFAPSDLKMFQEPNHKTGYLSGN
jgi:hypothetical protein